MYVAVPAAVGTTSGWTPIRGTRRDLIRGGAVAASSRTSTHVVRSVDVVAFLQRVAREDDFVFVKMDVEGVENAIVRRLDETGAHRLVDRVAIEYHGPAHDVAATKARLERWKLQPIGEASHGGMDSTVRGATLPARCAPPPESTPWTTFLRRWHHLPSASAEAAAIGR